MSCGQGINSHIHDGTDHTLLHLLVHILVYIHLHVHILILVQHMVHLKKPPLEDLLNSCGSSFFSFDCMKTLRVPTLVTQSNYFDTKICFVTSCVLGIRWPCFVFLRGRQREGFVTILAGTWVDFSSVPYLPGNEERFEMHSQLCFHLLC